MAKTTGGEYCRATPVDPQPPSTQLNETMGQITQGWYVCAGCMLDFFSLTVSIVQVKPLTTQHKQSMDNGFLFEITFLMLRSSRKGIWYILVISWLDLGWSTRFTSCNEPLYIVSVAAISQGSRSFLLPSRGPAIAGEKTAPEWLASPEIWSWCWDRLAKVMTLTSQRQKQRLWRYFKIPFRVFRKWGNSLF